MIKIFPSEESPEKIKEIVPYWAVEEAMGRMQHTTYTLTLIFIDEETGDVCAVHFQGPEIAQISNAVWSRDHHKYKWDTHVVLRSEEQ